MKISGDLVILLILSAFIAGLVYGEKSQCDHLRGSYSWDYGSCKID
jgi:hypothetical protein